MLQSKHFFSMQYLFISSSRACERKALCDLIFSDSHFFMIELLSEGIPSKNCKAVSLYFSSLRCMPYAKMTGAAVLIIIFSVAVLPKFFFCEADVFPKI